MEDRPWAEKEGGGIGQEIIVNYPLPATAVESKEIKTRGIFVITFWRDKILEHSDRGGREG